MRYEYETSPRKYSIEYNEKPKRKKAKKSTKANKARNISKVAQDKKAQRKEKAKFRAMLVLNCALFLGIMFTFIYRNALINQSFSEIQGLKAQISEIQKENDQLEISIQNSLNLNSIEQTAKEMLGMQKLTSKQTVYLSLPKKDYVEPSTEEVILEEKTNVIQNVIKYIMNLF